MSHLKDGKKSTGFLDVEFMLNLLKKLKKTEIGRFEAEKLVVTGENFFNYFKRKNF